jgi:hypothetical protein
MNNQLIHIKNDILFIDESAEKVSDHEKEFHELHIDMIDKALEAAFEAGAAS